MVGRISPGSGLTPLGRVLSQPELLEFSCLLPGRFSVGIRWCLERRSKHLYSTVVVGVWVTAFPFRPVIHHARDLLEDLQRTVPNTTDEELSKSGSLTSIPWDTQSASCRGSNEKAARPETLGPGSNQNRDNL